MELPDGHTLHRLIEGSAAALAAELFAAIPRVDELLTIDTQKAAAAVIYEHVFAGVMQVLNTMSAQMQETLDALQGDTDAD